MALNQTKIKLLKLNKLVLSIYLNLMKLQLDQAQLLIKILEIKMYFFEILFEAIKAMLKLRFHQNVQRLPTMLLFLGIASLTLVLN